MKRRKFGLFTGSSLLSVAALRNASGQVQSSTADPNLLKTTLTPLGAERAGNADGSIPAWTGGMVADPSSPVLIRVFQDEKPILKIDASNMDQYGDQLSDGVKLMMTNSDYYINVYPTHRTAAAPQYVYDNTAKNVTRAKFSPNGGRFGFTGAFGGPPFPIIDTAHPDIAGPQLIWNHLTAWNGFCYQTFSPGFVMTEGSLVLSEGGKDLFRFPYYDPDGSPETFDGYLSKTHLLFDAPGNFNGQEVLTWHSANTELNPDITWTLLNGQGRVRKAPDEAYDTPNGYFNGSSNYDESSGFYGDPHQYDWRFIEKKEMFIPYHCNNVNFSTAEAFMLPKYPNPEIARWEKHRVWVIEATIHPGIRNVLSRRKFYIDEDSWYISLGEGYDNGGDIASIYLQFLRVVPAQPGVSPAGFVNLHPLSNNYLFAGQLNVPGFSTPERLDVISESQFDPQLMAANASF